MITSKSKTHKHYFHQPNTPDHFIIRIKSAENSYPLCSWTQVLHSLSCMYMQFTVNRLLCSCQVFLTIVAQLNDTKNKQHKLRYIWLFTRFKSVWLTLLQGDVPKLLFHKWKVENGTLNMAQVLILKNFSNVFSTKAQLQFGSELFQTVYWCVCFIKMMAGNRIFKNANLPVWTWHCDKAHIFISAS